MKSMLPDEYRKYKETHTIRVPFKGWGSPAVRVWTEWNDLIEKGFPDEMVIWNMECVSDQMWTPGEYDIYKIYFAEPDAFESRERAKELKFRLCRVEYAAVRRENPLPVPERYEQLLEDFRPHLSDRRYKELLQELEGKTPEEKEMIITEEMEELTAVMSYY